MRLVGFAKSARASVALVLVALGMVACGGSDGPGTGDDANLTQTKLVTVQFEVVGAAVGALGGPEDAARASWQAACDAWVASVEKAAAPAKIEGHECGTPKDIGGNDGWHFSSTPIAHVAARLPEGSEPLAFEPGPVAGNLGPRAVAYGSWQAACDASIARVKAIYGDRLLGATCQLPKDIGGNDGWLLSSSLSLWIAPTAGSLVTAEGWTAGRSGPRGTALGGWREACDAWVADLAGRSSAAFLGAFSCGEAKDVGDGSYLFAAPATARFELPLADGTELETKELGSIQGSAGPRDDAIASWQKACAAALDQAKVDAGERYLAGVCHQPKDVGSSGWQYASPATVWLGDLAKAPPEPEPGPAPDDDDDDLLDSPVADKCQERCLAMMDACDAGPVDSTCQAMCAPSPTEAQIACAEATSCDELQNWSLECLLFQ